MAHSTVSRRRLRERAEAAKNRRELVAANFNRRELMKMGLLTSAGWLVAKRGLSARAVLTDGEEIGQTSSPPTKSFTEALPLVGPTAPIGRTAKYIPKDALTPGGAPAIYPQAGEGRTRPHQAFNAFPPAVYSVVEQRDAFVRMSMDLPPQPIWGFAVPGYPAVSPGPTHVARYGKPLLVRNVNNLPADNGGFGKAYVSTHLHNGHTPSESDGNPLDVFRRGQFYDHHYPNTQAGALSYHMRNRQRVNGRDIRESMSTLWYHDHSGEFTSQNVYKGLAGFYLLFNEYDTGNEYTGFRLPSGKFDVPLMFADKVFDDEGLLFFDLFNLDGILGDRFTVNGKIQPYMYVHPRRYRFRLLNAGPSRFYQFHLTDYDQPDRQVPFWHISCDGNLLPAPQEVLSTRLSVSERADVIIDFGKLKEMGIETIDLENRLEQTDGRAPGGVLRAGQGTGLVRFKIVLPKVDDASDDPAAGDVTYYELPEMEPATVVRRFRFDRTNGMWAINNQLDGEDIRFRVKRNTAERWIFQNNSGGWQHPIHVHFEEFRILSRNGVPAAANSAESGRKDTARLEFGQTIEMFMRFRDFKDDYVMHCHNVVHEDHMMMLQFRIDEDGDTNGEP